VNVKVNTAFFNQIPPTMINLKCAAGLACRSQGVFFMRKSVFVIAVIAAACSSVAFAGEVKQDKKAPAIMSDAQMDKVTAGDAGGVPNLGGGQGHGYGYGAGIGAPGNGKGHGTNSNGRFGL
jgi:hypothetical protein